MSEYDVPDTPPEQGVRREALRASNAERDEALHVLAGHFADGRLERAEFDERADAALAARTRDELSALFADLPGPVPVPTSASPAASGALSPADRMAAAMAAARERRAAMLAVRPPLLLVPIFIMFAALAVLHGYPPFPLIPLMFILSRRRRRWYREARPWT